MNFEAGVKISRDHSFTGTSLNVCRKIRAMCEGHFSHHRQYFANPNDGDVQKWVPNLMFKFYDDPIVNEFEIVVLLAQVRMYAGKRESFGRERRKNKFESKDNIEMYRKCKKWTNMFIYSYGTLNLLFRLFFIL